MRASFRMLGFFIFAISFLASRAGAAAADDYSLGAGDHLTLKVLEWRPDRGEPFEWPGFSGDYVIGADGALPLPIVGFVPAQGRTISEVSKTISQLLQKEAGLAHPLQVALQIVQYRPFYVYGGVEKPGEYAYRPGMTVLEAVSLAGGPIVPRKPKTSSAARISRRAARSAGIARPGRRCWRPAPGFRPRPTALI